MFMFDWMYYLGMKNNSQIHLPWNIFWLQQFKFQRQVWAIERYDFEITIQNGFSMTVAQIQV